DISGMILLDKVNRMIDIIDLSIKSLQTSSQYQTESEKMKQVAMFGEMVKEFSGVMNKIIYEVEGDSPYNVNNIKSNIKEILEYKKQSLSVSDLDISREFSVNYAQTNIRSIKKIADIHTVIHQTCLDSIGRYNSRIMERVKLQYPAEIQKLKELVEKGESDIGINSQKLPYLISSKFIYPEIELSYNIPLRDHSGNIAIKYDLNKKKYKISYKLYGGNEDYRWNNVCNYGKIFFDNFINYNRISNDFNDSGVHFEVEISDKESLEKAVKIFYTFSQASFDSNILQNLFKEGGNYYNQTLEKFNELSTVLNLTEIQREFVAEACVSGLVSLKEIKEKKVLDRVLVLEEKIASKELQNIWRLQSLRSLLFCPQKRFDILLSPEWKSYNINLSTILDCGERDSRVLSDEAFLAYKNKFSLRDVLYLYNNGNLVHYAANNQNLNIVKSIVNDSRSSKDGKALAFKLLYRSLASSSASANKDEFLECASEYKNIYNFLHNKQEDDYFCETEHRALISYAIRDNNPNILKVLIEVSRDCGMELQFSDLLLLRGIDEKGLKSFVKVAVELKMDDSLVKSILKYPDDFTKALNLLLEGGVDVNTIQKYQDKITRACPSMKSKVEEYIASKSLQEEALSATSGIGEFISKVSNAQNPENVERAHTTMKIPPDSDKQGRPL
ncbi:MAG: hypothetical protein KA998_02070, partial [Rickettsiaceae bacterium]|nr:hypothetical protein [Rickettsiaceae bacterium]